MGSLYFDIIYFKPPIIIIIIIIIYNYTTSYIALYIIALNYPKAL